MPALTDSKGNILSVTEGIIVQQVNCQGVMGSGVAAAIRAWYPQVFTEYEAFCKSKEAPTQLDGELLMVRATGTLWIANIFGQHFYGRNPGAQPRGMYTSYDSLDAGLLKLRNWIDSEKNDAIDRDLGFANPTIHFPQIGCGLGGGDWKVVSALINSRLFDFNRVFWTL
jgi:O-acetyl-ADP-ribose deacetylase (regulator of RNase III)